MRTHHSLRTYIARAYSSRHEPESIRILGQAYWWGILLCALVIMLDSGWLAQILLTSTFDTIDGQKNKNTTAALKVVGVDQKLLHSIISSVSSRSHTNTPDVPSVGDPSR